MPFQINSKLADNGHDLGKHGICHILLKNNAIFPWFILVPEVDESIIELHELRQSDYMSVCASIRRISRFADSYFQPKKINVGSLGNIVQQMHIHVVARTESDPAWPGVVWGYSESKLYPDAEIAAIREAYQKF